MHTSIKISTDQKRAIMLRSFHNRTIKRLKASQYVPRKESVFGTKSYNDALQRAFNKAKEQIYFNTDMTNFITLTYRQEDNTIEQVLQDVKIFIQKEIRQRERSRPAGSGRETPKYLYVMEYQKRGSIHVHMIANNYFSLQVNQNGYNSLTNWSHGFSSVLSIKDFDNNFRPYLYLFKYMKKSQRIGKAFVHSSRNLSKTYSTTTEQLDILDYDTINMEYTSATIETTNFHYFKNYLKKDDILTSQH